MRQFGLIGFPLSHSFSKGYFTNHFLTENILDAQYENYPIESIDLLTDLWKNNPALKGLNVTIPYKKLVIPFLQHTSSVVQSIQACNCIKLHQGALYGYNTDVIGFEKSLLPYLQPHHQKALIFGTGGAAAAAQRRPGPGFCARAGERGGRPGAGRGAAGLAGPTLPPEGEPPCTRGPIAAHLSC